MSDQPIKEWVKANRPANGPAHVTVTLVRGNHTAKWTVRAYTKIRESALEARAEAKRMLDQLSELDDLDELG